MRKKPKILHWALFLMLVFATISCDKDFYEDSFYQQQTQEDIKVNKISFEKFNKKFQKLKNKPQIDNLMKPSKEFQAQARTTTTSGVVIYTDDIREITQGDYTSYTMLMELPNQTDDKFFNLTIEEKNNQAGVFVTKYTPTESWKANPNQLFDGQKSMYRINYATEGGNNSPGNLHGIDLLHQEPGDGSGYYTSTTYPWDCDGQVNEIITLEAYKCACGHWPWSYPPCEGCGSYPHFPGYHEITTYECIPDDMWGWPNDGGSTNDGPGDNTGGSGSGNPSGSSGVSSTPGSITTIVNPISTESTKTPCIQLKRLTSTTHTKHAFTSLDQVKGGTNEYGWAFKTFPNSTATAPPVAMTQDPKKPHNVDFSNHYGGDYFGLGHCHTNPDNGAIQMFSYGDIRGLFSISISHIMPNNEPRDYSLYFIGGTFMTGQYALKIKDKNSFYLNWGGTGKMDKELEYQYQELANNEQLTTANLEKVLLKMLAKYNLGVSLYKANDDLSNWSEVTLDPQNPNNPPIKTPCN